MRSLALLFALVLLAGCSIDGEEDGTPVTSDELRQLVLQPADVPRVFIRFDEGRQRTAEQPVGRADMSRLGRQGGWKARYRRSGTTQTKGPLVIASLVDVFDSAGGAEDEFGALQDDLRAGGLGWRPVESPQLGDEVFAMTHVQGSGPSKVDFFHVAWRDDNVVASVAINGFGGKVELADAVGLARRQDRRIARFVGS